MDAALYKYCKMSVYDSSISIFLLIMCKNCIACELTNRVRTEKQDSFVILFWAVRDLDFVEP